MGIFQIGNLKKRESLKWGSLNAGIFKRESLKWGIFKMGNGR